MTVDGLQGAPTWLYRLSCAHGGLLYVGITSDVERRLAEHRATKPWWPEVEHIVAWEFPDRAAARAAELDAILLDSPQYNLADVDDLARRYADRWSRLHGTAGLPVWTPAGGRRDPARDTPW